MYSHETYGSNVASQISKDQIKQCCSADLRQAWYGYEPITLTLERLKSAHSVNDSQKRRRERSIERKMDGGKREM